VARLYNFRDTAIPRFVVQNAVKDATPQREDAWRDIAVIGGTLMTKNAVSR